VQRTRAVAAATIIVLALAGCSSEDIGESVMERSIEASQDGEVDIDIDGGQVRIETDEGTVEFETDDDGSFTMTGPEGSVVMQGDESGMTITDGDESFETSATSELPEDFPADLPLPAGQLVGATRVATGDGVSFALSYELDAAAFTEVYESLAADLVAAGYRSEFEMTDAATVTAQFTDDTTAVSFTGLVDGEQASLQYLVFPVDA
jgi:hypothetical protein